MSQNNFHWFAQAKVMGVYYWIPVTAIQALALRAVKVPTFCGSMSSAWSSELVLNGR